MGVKSTHSSNSLQPWCIVCYLSVVVSIIFPIFPIVLSLVLMAGGLHCFICSCAQCVVVVYGCRVGRSILRYVMVILPLFFTSLVTFFLWRFQGIKHSLNTGKLSLSAAQTPRFVPTVTATCGLPSLWLPGLWRCARFHFVAFSSSCVRPR